MDFSKIKKIFYIVAIISMLLSIKSKVFAYSYTDVQNECVTDALSRYKNSFNLDGNVLLVATDKDNYTYVGVSDSTDVEFLDYTSENPNFRINGEYQLLFYRYNNTTFDDRSRYGTQVYNALINNSDSCYSPYIIKEYPSGNTIYTPETPVLYPHFDNTEEIRQGNPESIIISRGPDYSENTPLYFHLLKITNTVPDGNQSTYYYDSKVFKLTKDSKYYKTYDADTENKYSYYYIDRSALTLDTNSSYLYVLSNSGDSISNSYGILQPDTSFGIYDVIESDTAGVITEQQALNDKITNINNNQQEFQQQQQEFQQQQQEFQNQNTILPETDTNISDSLHFDNSTPQFSNLFTDYFSQLTTLVADLGNYDNSSVKTINLPVPHTNTNIAIRSDIVSSHLPADILFIIQSVWYFIFGKYFITFILKMYKLFTTGQILDYYSVDGEVITHDML